MRNGLLLAIAIAAGCSGPAPIRTASTNSKTVLRLAVIPKGTTHEFWKTVHAGAQQGAKDAGVEIIWKGPLKEDDRESQVKTVEDFVVQKVDGIALAPLDDTALRQPVVEAQDAGIPVLIFDSGLKHDDIVSFVATDNFRGGEIAGEAMVKALAGKGDVFVLRYQEGSASTREREEGFLAKAKAGGLRVVVENRYGGATVESAQAEAENLIQRLKTAGGLSAQGVFCPNESTTMGMLNALRGASLAGKIRFYGFDASTKLAEALKANEINGLVLQDPFNMGRLAVTTLASKLRGENVSPRVDTGATLVTPENMGTPESAKLLAPPQA